MKVDNDVVDTRIIGRNITRLTDYVGNTKPVTWKCDICQHIWENIPDRVIGSKKIGCPRCSGKIKCTNISVDVRIPTTIKRIEPVIGIHGKILWSCVLCEHAWVATPSNIIQGSGCPQCADTSITNASVDAMLADRGIIRLGDIVNTHTKTIWGCLRCDHQWKTSPTSIISSTQSGCPKCAKKISSGEQEWLNFKNIPTDTNHRQVIISISGTTYRVDGYDPKTNTIYEYWGDYWHGNPKKYPQGDINPSSKKTYGELYANTQRKRADILSAGYQLEEIWESEWVLYKKQQESNSGN